MSTLALSSSVALSGLRDAAPSMDTPSQGRDTMSGLAKTKFGRREKRFEGLTLRDYQARELGRILRETWPHETARSAAVDLREPVQTIRNWLDGTSFPGGFKLLKLQHRFGLEMLARLDPEPDSEVRVALAMLRRQAIEAEIERLSAQLAAPMRA
jgi:hypothetical protein